MENEINRAAIEAYGIAVRAGVVTPQQNDEDFFRQKLGVPPASDAVAAVWGDQPTRKPVTLKDGKSDQPAQSTANDDQTEQ